MTRLLTRKDIASVLTIGDCITAVEEAFRAHGEKRFEPPQSLGFHAQHGGFHVKAALMDRFAAKVNANFPMNPERLALPTIQGVLVVMDAGNGTPLAIMDSMEITILRTAAASAVAAKHLARRDASVATIVGCGAQARAQLHALTRVRKITNAWVVDTNHEAAERFASDMSSRLGIEVQSRDSIDEAVALSDVVITCTTSRTPVLDLRHRHPGLFIAGVGADNPEKNELSPALLAVTRVVPDIAAQAATMGDLHHALVAGTMTIDAIHGELAEIVCGTKAGRSSDDEIFVFDSTGTAIQDVAAASIALDRAIELGIGLEIDLAH